MKSRSFSTFVFVVLSVLFVGQEASAQDADAIAKRLQDKYDTVETLRAGFTQTMKSEFLDSSESASGTFIVNGKQFRVETPKQTFVTDGLVTWLYNSESNELLINDFVEEEMFPVRDMIFNYSEHYDVDGVRTETHNGQLVDVLSLTAKDEMDLYRSLTLYVRRSDTVVTRLDILDANETTMTFELTDIDLNPKLDGDLFTFKAPTGSNVIDLRS